MSHIPNAAIPHAGPQPETQAETARGSESRFGQLAEKVREHPLADKVREHPKTAAAAAGVVAAGLVAAAAIPAIRGRSRDSKSGSGRKKG